ncbi:MAG: putative lipid II flippase FtsW [Clostridiales bacterium]|nr:MAG: putative lipid II flippase FtsW [Clostridiales bacterium]RGB68384.1 putative lipid II flippase FtsW [Harryflintia acetispora]
MDVVFLVLVLSLLTVGLVMLFSASYAYAYYYYKDSFYFISKQLVFAVVGVTAMFVLAFFDYHHFQKLALPIMGVTVFLLVLVRILPTRVGDFHRWIRIGSFSVQPSEIAKFAVVVLFAQILSKNYSKIKTFKYGILPFVIILGLLSFLMLLQPHVSGVILIMLIGAVVMLVGGVDVKWFVFAGVGALILIGGALLIPGAFDYARSRLEFWFDPWSDPQGAGFQTIQSLYAIGSGGLLGVGIGNSRQKYLYLPEVQNDFVFAIVGEELGFIGATLIIVMFALLIWRGFVIAARAKDRFGMLLAVGLTAQVGIQAFLNIAVVTNTIPNTGISLPFFSYGGTSLMMLLGQMGIVLSVSRQSTLLKE